MKKLVQSGFPGTSSTLPRGRVPAGPKAPSKNIVAASHTDTSSVLRKVSPASRNTRGGPAQKAPRGKGVIASGGGSFGQS